MILQRYIEPERSELYIPKKYPMRFVNSHTGEDLIANNQEELIDLLEKHNKGII